jgi:hypothetical protein
MSALIIFLLYFWQIQKGFFQEIANYYKKQSQKCVEVH